MSWCPKIGVLEHTAVADLVQWVRYSKTHPAQPIFYQLSPPLSSEDSLCNAQLPVDPPLPALGSLIWNTPADCGRQLRC